MLVYSANIKFLRTMVHGEALRQVDRLSAEVGSTTSENLRFIILGLGAHFFPVNGIPKQKLMIRRGMKNPRSLKVRRYATRLIKLND